MANDDLESRVTLVEARVTILEELVKTGKKVGRRKKQYTDEEKAAIRARLLAGQEVARKRRETEAKETEKTESSTTKKAKNAGKT